MAAATVEARFQRASDGGILPPVRVGCVQLRPLFGVPLHLSDCVIRRGRDNASPIS
jgi:hypothetical protein